MRRRRLLAAHQRSAAALVYFLIVYTPLQNVVLPAAARLLGSSPALMSPLIALKDILVAVALVTLLSLVRRMRLRVADMVGLAYLALLLANAAMSPSDLTSAALGVRAYAIPVELYFLGRLSSGRHSGGSELLKFALVVGVTTLVFSLGEYALSMLGVSSLERLWEGYFEVTYGHGRPTTDLSAPGFLGLRRMPGPFGHSLIMSSFLRLLLCLLVFYLLEYRGRAGGKHVALLGLIIVGSILTFSRYGMAALIVIVALLLASRRPLSVAQKAVILAMLVPGLIVAAPTLGKVIRTTMGVEDESTQTHVESLRDLATMEMTWFGHGLGTGAHSKVARTSEVTSAGEGLLRQGIPEIGVLGIALFIGFTAMVIGGLLGRSESRRRRGLALDSRAWVAVPLVFELLRIPFDIAIRGFLASGLAWFVAGYFYSRRWGGEPAASGQGQETLGRVPGQGYLKGSLLPRAGRALPDAVRAGPFLTSRR